MYSNLSKLRRDDKPFDENDFIQYAKENVKKYSLVENGDDLLVSTWFSDRLIDDYRRTIKKIIN